MTSRGRVVALSSAGLLVVVWTAAQFLLNRRAVDRLRAFNATWNREHAAIAIHVSVPDSLWVRAGIESFGFAVLVIGLGALVAYGGHRWWGVLVAAYPAAAALSFSDADALGSGWAQPNSDVTLWLKVGTAVDVGFVAVVMILLILALPRRDVRVSMAGTVARAIPPAALVVGWWIMRTRYTDPTNRTWLARAVLFVLIAAMIAVARLPAAVRLGAVVLVLPFAVGPVLDGVFGSFPHLSFPSGYYLRHVAVAAGVGLYAVAGLSLDRLFRPRPAARPA